MKLPPDIDRLAWSVAESGDPRLREEFAHRHPEFAEEMERRATLVDDRGHTPAHAASGIALPLRRAPVPMWANVLVGLAVGAVIVSLFIPRNERVESDPVQAAPLRSAQNASSGVMPPANPQPASTVQDVPPVSTTSPTPIVEKGPTTMRLEGTRLHDALALIAAAGDLNVRVDSEVPDTEVREELTNLTPREMIARLGEEYGFRIVEESPGSLVLVPLSEVPPQAENSGETPPQTPPAGTNDSDFPVFADENR